jgi:uncharacterized tellurite resistance protein B-like protein
MLDSLRRIFGADSEKREPFAKTEAELRMATCALLVETAMADDNLSPEEFQKIVQVLKGRFDLTDAGVHELIEAAREEHRKSTDVWSFASQVNEALTREQKFEVMEMIWKVVYADGTMDKFEDYMAKKLHRLLRIDHPTFIALKLKVKSELEN